MYMLWVYCLTCDDVSKLVPCTTACAAAAPEAIARRPSARWPSARGTATTATTATTAKPTEEPSGGTGRRSADAARTTSGEVEATMIGDTTTGDTTTGDTTIDTTSDVSCAHALRKREQSFAADL